MDPAAHCGHRLAGQVAEDELVGVAFDMANGPPGDLGVRDGRGILDSLGQGAQAGAEDQAQLGLEAGAVADALRSDSLIGSGSPSSPLDGIQWVITPPSGES